VPGGGGSGKKKATKKIMMYLWKVVLQMTLIGNAIIKYVKIG
jgi:myosin heavy subunit